MTTRPLYISLYKKNMTLYYVDHLCVHNLYRKKGIAPQIIQTHEYNQRHNNKEIKVSLFKREGQINGIVPLVFYYTYGYKKISVYKINDPSVYLFPVNKTSVYKFLDFLKNNKNRFNSVITPYLSNLISLIESKSLYIYLLTRNSNVLASYIFKNTDTLYYGKKSIECISSISSIENDNTNLFYKGFTLSYHNLFKQIKSKTILIEDVADNSIIIKNINDECFFSSPTAFFLYNYISKPVNKSNFIYIY